MTLGHILVFWNLCCLYMFEIYHCENTLKFIFFMCMSILSACMSVHYLCVWSPQEAAKSIRSCETGVTNGFEQLCGYW